MEERCLLLLFQVPSFVELEIFPLSSEQETALVAEGVVQLTCGGYQFATKVCSYCIVTCHMVPSIELNKQMTVVQLHTQNGGVVSGFPSTVRFTFGYVRYCIRSI